MKGKEAINTTFEVPLSEFSLECVDNGKNDIFITFLSFEDRCSSFIRYFDKYEPKKVIILYNAEISESNINCLSKTRLELCDNHEQPCYNFKVNRQNITDFLNEKSINYTEIISSSLDVTRQQKAIQEVVKQIKYLDNSLNNVIIDISCFNRDQLFTLLFFIRASVKKCNIDLIYVAPLDYSVNGILSVGALTPRNVIGFAGKYSSNLKTDLIVLTGFETDRVLKIIQEYEPELIDFGHGSNGTKPDFIRRNLDASELVCQYGRMNNAGVGEFDFRTNKIENCVEDIEKVINQKLGKYNITIAPMNTKLSTIATYIVAERHPEIQLCYCLPSEYNCKSYSNGESTVFTFTMPPAPDIIYEYEEAIIKDLF